MATLDWVTKGFLSEKLTFETTLLNDKKESANRTGNKKRAGAEAHGETG